MTQLEREKPLNVVIRSDQNKLVKWKTSKSTELFWLFGYAYCRCKHGHDPYLSIVLSAKYNDLFCNAIRNEKINSQI